MLTCGWIKGSDDGVCCAEVCIYVSNIKIACLCGLYHVTLVGASKLANQVSASGFA